MFGYMLSYSGRPPYEKILRTEVLGSKRRILMVDKENFLHNTNGPALIEYSKDSKIISEEFYFNGFRHRSNGPSCIWYKEGKFHFISFHYHGRSYHTEALKWLEDNDMLWYDMDEGYYNQMWMELL